MAGSQGLEHNSIGWSGHFLSSAADDFQMQIIES